MAKLTPEQIEVAKAWLHDLFVAGGLLISPKRPVVNSSYSWDQYNFMYGAGGGSKQTIMTNAKVLCEALKIRKCLTQVFLDCDKALEILQNYAFVPSIKEPNGMSMRPIRKKSTILARYLAWFCANYGYYWDNRTASTYEMDEIKKTLLGSTLFDYHCFATQVDSATTKTATTTTGTTTAGTTTNTGTSGQPQNSFKARGPLSGVAIDLKGTPGQKQQLTGKIYCIIGFDANNNPLSDSLFVRPVESDPKVQNKYVVNGTNKVLYGSAKGYGYCTCFFDTFTDATIFLTAVQNSNLKIGSADHLGIASKSALSNGYFRVGTEFGDCYISANKLNENVDDKLVEDIPNKTEENKVMTYKERVEALYDDPKGFFSDY